MKKGFDRKNALKILNGLKTVVGVDVEQIEKKAELLELAILGAARGPDRGSLMAVAEVARDIRQIVSLAAGLQRVG